ncbi:MAG: PcfJ domain-containing protein, partial [Alphaproteobacteria bacterium]|nr:PcfJ domain-containing protein [Alphaproteobacteria bacterium]
HIYANKQKSGQIYEMLTNKLSELCEGLTYEEASHLIGVFIRNNYNVSERIRDLVDKVDSCEYLIKELGITYKLTNIDNDVQFLKTKWEKEKTAIENARFAKNQSDPCLPFEDDNYRIYIPTSRDDLAKIGKTFSNCANGWEWDTRLRDGRYWLVVVVDKATNEMKVCVDIYRRDKDIGQYLLPYNHNVEPNSSLRAFGEKYQHHLTTFKAE